MRQFTIMDENQMTCTITESQLYSRMKFACRGFEDLTSAEELLESSITNFYEGIKESEVDQANMMAARAKIEIEPAYSKVAARLLLDVLYRETMGISASDPSLESTHREYFKKYLKHAISVDRVSPELLNFDIDKLASAMQIQRDDSIHLPRSANSLRPLFPPPRTAPLRNTADLLDARRHGPCPQ